MKGENSLTWIYYYITMASVITVSRMISSEMISGLLDDPKFDLALGGLHSHRFKNFISREPSDVIERMLQHESLREDREDEHDVHLRKERVGFLEVEIERRKRITDINKTI